MKYQILSSVGGRGEEKIKMSSAEIFTQSALKH